VLISRQDITTDENG